MSDKRIISSPIISIIIPVYNVERYLRKCLESVLNQTYNNYEVIMVDDGSTDNSGAICDEYAVQDDRFRVIHRENGGLSEARNTGLDDSNGKFIYFLDSDDWIEMDTLEKLINTANVNGADFVFFDGKSFEESEKGYSIRQGYQRKRVYDSGIGIKVFDQLQKNNDFKSAVPTYLWKKDFLSQNMMQFYPGILYEDMIFSFEAFCKAKSVAHCHEELYQRRIRAGSITSTKSDIRNFNCSLIVYEEVVRIAQKTGYSERASVINYITRVAMRPLEIFDQLPSKEKKVVCDRYNRFVTKIRDAKGYGNLALFYRTYGKIPWAVQKVIEKTIRKKQ